MVSVQIQPEDRRFIKNDPNFNPNRNKAIVDETIRETERFFAELEELKDKEALNRIDILTSYGIYRFNKGTKDLKGFLGRQQYNDLVGEKIRDKVRAMESINKLGGDKRILL